MTAGLPLATGASGLECWRLGGTTCLFRPANHATCLVNDAAADLLAAIDAGLADADIAADLAAAARLSHQTALEHVAALRTRSLASGLIGPLPAPREGAGEGRAARAQGTTRATRYALGPDRSVDVVVDAADLRRLVAEVLAPLRCANSARCNARHAVVATRHGEHHRVELDGLALVDAADLATARRVILQAALLSLHARADARAILHGSAVAIDGRGIVLAGATGSGKSTLMLSLVASGARYLADDFTPLSGDGARLATFPVAASIKAGSWPNARAMFPAIDAVSTFSLGPREIRYLDLTAHRENRTRDIPAAAIVFPRYEPAAPSALAPIAPEDAFRLLIETGSAPAGSQPSMRPIVELVGRTPAWLLVHGEVAEAAALVKGLAQ